jgi:DNA polymerase-4
MQMVANREVKFAHLSLARRSNCWITLDLSMPHIILHLDLDAFFCAVEELRDPSLHGKSFAVGGKPDERGVVASCSYAARAFGVRSAMPMSQALRLCRGLLIVPPHRAAYEEMSEQVMARLRNLSPLVEQISIDEAFLDISDIASDSQVFGLSNKHQETLDSTTIAHKLQKQILDELRLPCSVGVASNKLVAKIATETGKKAARGSRPPQALTVVPAGSEAEFLSPLPVSMLWGVGPKTEKRLSELGIHTIGQIATWPESDLAARFGENGREMSRHAKGLDERPVVTERETKSISQEITFSRDVSDDKILETTLKELSTEVGRSLRREELAGKTVKLKLRWPDFTTLTRQTTLPSPTDLDDDIYGTALDLLHKVRAKGRPVRLIGVGMSGLGKPIRQMELWGQGDEKARRLRAVLDELQEKYGKNMIDRGR